jgi:hypothetical protein
MGILSRPSTWFSSEPRPVSVDSAQNGQTRKGQHPSDAVELGGRGRNGDLVNTRTVQRDRHGVALSPQPSDDPLDPLNWKPWLKFMVLAQVSLLAFLSLLSAALIVSPVLRLRDEVVVTKLARHRPRHSCRCRCSCTETWCRRRM